MNNNVITKTLYLSTQSSGCIPLNGSKKSKVQFNLYDYLPQIDEKFVQNITISVPYAVLPNSCYNINANNNRLEILYIGEYEVFTFTPGNYNVQTFMAAFAALVPPEFSISFNTTTNKFSITNGSAPFQLLNTSTIDYVMGFSGTETSTVASAPYSLTLSRSVCFLPTPVFNITCSQIYNGVSIGAYSPKYGNILASVPNLAKLGNSNVLQNATEAFQFLPSSDGTLIITILDSNGYEVDFNGLASYLAFQFKITVFGVANQDYKPIGNLQDLVQKATSRRLIEEGEQL